MALLLSASQMGLLLDLTPDAGMDDDGNDEDLEAELLSLVGGGKGGRPQGKKGDGRCECTSLAFYRSRDSRENMNKPEGLEKTLETKTQFISLKE